MESNDPNQQQLFPLSPIHPIFSAQTTASHRRYDKMKDADVLHRYRNDRRHHGAKALLAYTLSCFST